MIRFVATQHVAVRVQGFRIQVGDGKPIEDVEIAHIVHLLSDHAPNRIIVTVSVTIVQAAIGVASKRIAVYMHWLMLARSSGHFDRDHAATIQDKPPDVRVGQEIDADFLRIVYCIKQVGDDPIDILNASCCEAPVLLLKPEHNQAAVCVGKGTISGPKIPRELAFPVGAGCEFTFHIDGFGKTGKIAKRVERDRAKGLTLPVSIVPKSHG